MFLFLAESDVLIGVANARAGLTGALQKAGGSDPAELANANQALTSALGRMNVVIEAYPQLKSDQGFLKLQDELTGTENRIAVPSALAPPLRPPSPP